MKQFTLPLAATLLLLSPFAHAEQRRGSDLTYCLALPTAQLIAKCSGEHAGGNKGMTMSPAQVDKLLTTLPPPAPAAQQMPAETKPMDTGTKAIRPEVKTEIPAQQ